MRNLKKVLSLALALVMLLGMMVVGAGAATSFKDDADIENREAAAVVSTIKVLVGDENGYFNPTETLDRASAAMVVARLDLGVDAAAALKSSGLSPFSDVPSTHWAAGVIEYCASQNFILGDGTGKFNPDGKVTGVQFGIMLSKVLGYQDDAEKLKGPNWAVNGATLARKAGLLNGVTAGNDPMTRDEMAQMTFNALTAITVEYEGLNIDINGVTLTSKATPRLHSVDKATGITTYDRQPIGATTPIRLCEDKFPLLKLSSYGEDKFGRVQSVWTWRNVEIEETKTYTAPDARFTAETTETAVRKEIGKAGSVANVYVDGKVSTASVTAKYIADQCANGRLVEVFLNNRDKTLIDKVVVINTYVGKISSVNSSKGTVTVAPQNATAPEGKTSLLNRSFETDGYSIGDVVRYTAAYNNSGKYDIQTVDVLEVNTTGVLTGWKGTNLVNNNTTGNSLNEFTVEGHDTYEWSVNNVVVNSEGEPTANGVADFGVRADEINVYEDEYGYAIYVSGVEGTKNYAAVIGLGTVNTHGSETNGATLLLPTGEIKEVTAKADWDTLQGRDADGGYAPVAWDQGVDDNLVRDGLADLVTYTVDSKGVYNLTVVGKTNSTPAGTTLYTGNYDATARNAGTTFTSGRTAFNIYTKFDDAALASAGVKTYYATNKTVFMVAVSDNNGAAPKTSYSVYTGYANAPSLISANSNLLGISFAVSKNTRNQLDAVYINVTTGGVEANNANNIYFVKSEQPEVSSDSDGVYYKLPAVVDGVQENILIRADLNEDWDENGAVGGNTTLEGANAGLYVIKNVSKNEAGVIEDCTVVTKTNAFGATNGGTGTTAPAKGVLGISAVSYDYNASATKVFYTNTKYNALNEDQVAGVQTDSNDVVYATFKTGTATLEYVFIVEVDGGRGDAVDPTPDKVETGKPMESVSDSDLGDNKNLFVPDASNPAESGWESPATYAVTGLTAEMKNGTMFLSGSVGTAFQFTGASTNKIKGFKTTTNGMGDYFNTQTDSGTTANGSTKIAIIPIQTEDGNVFLWLVGNKTTNFTISETVDGVDYAIKVNVAGLTWAS